MIRKIIFVLSLLISFTIVAEPAAGLKELSEDEMNTVTAQFGTPEELREEMDKKLSVDDLTSLNAAINNIDIQPQSVGVQGVVHTRLNDALIH